jgi:outer membrane protein assembly factor BamB
VDSGSAYLFDAYSGEQILKLVPDDGVAEDWFGFRVALGDGIVAVGAYNDDDNGENSGSVYVFDTNTGQQLIKLLAEDGESGDRFGVSISVDDGVIAVGAMFDDVYHTESGSAYLFDAKTGQQLSKLIPSRGGFQSFFGRSLSIDDGNVAVAAPNYGLGGEIYLFDTSTGEEMLRMQPFEFWQSFEGFGFSISQSAGKLVIGAINSAHNQIRSGAVYVASLLQQRTYGVLLPSDGEHRDFFGTTIDIDGQIVAATKPIYVGTSSAHSGLVYVYTTLENFCPADVNQNHEYDLNDVFYFEFLLLSRDPAADITEDGMLNYFDISAFLTVFAAGCP